MFGDFDDDKNGDVDYDNDDNNDGDFDNNDDAAADDVDNGDDDKWCKIFYFLLRKVIGHPILNLLAVSCRQ